MLWRIRLPLRWLVLMIVVTQCISCGINDEPTPSTSQPTPTIAAFFQEPPTATIYQPQPSPTARPTTVLPPTPMDAVQAAPTALVLGDQYTLLGIYDEQLNSDWTLKNSSNVRIDSGYKGYAYSGVTSLLANPQGAFSKLQFSVGLRAKDSYRRDKVAGISFWVSGKDQAIVSSDLAVTVVGSNDVPYWVTNDSSVTAPGQVPNDAPLFSETRLYFLGINRPIEPNTWAEVVLWLDDRPDPNYTYVTGLYIKNDEQFQQKFYIDKVSLILYAK